MVVSLQERILGLENTSIRYSIICVVFNNAGAFKRNISDDGNTYILGSTAFSNEPIPLN
ncbi:hypothetical protein AAE02nite_32180 [Adhaeribacter aerolatus]|uniref:Uncharacterized protein n=1 Tax=Adhaeribacter aerolatus TaxID=670289 RepID=A0A512B0R7_9BACT|nr:hypothetical protein AAE02nite_32180 [Adhaeribacter aerolatus]